MVIGQNSANDQVNSPGHYTQYQGFEVIDVCDQLRAPDGGGSFNRGNAFKYLARAGWKNPEKHVEDLEKAKYYIQREIDRVAVLWQNGRNLKKTPVLSYCPYCEKSLNANWACPEGHGFLESTGSNGPVWITPKVHNAGAKDGEDSYVYPFAVKDNPTLKDCPECGSQLTESIDKTLRYCPEGHGSLRVTEVATEAN